MAFKGAIFDLDGVIVDSVPLHFESWRKLFQDDFNIPFDQETYEDKVDGKPRLDSIRLLLPHLNEEEVVKAGDIKQRYYMEMLTAGELKKFDAAFALIDDLLAHDILLAAASSSKNAHHILEIVGIIDKFTVVVGGGDFVNGKPNPEIFLNAAAGLRLGVDECIVFEDSIAGVQAAKAGGFLCVGIDRHNHPENYVTADLQVPNLQHVDYDVLNDMFR